MSHRRESSSLSATQVVDRYFLEHRAKLIDIAAFLDRVDRVDGAAEGAAGRSEDFRMVQFREALALLSDDGGWRAKRVLETFTDPTTEPIRSAEGMKGASGAWSGGRASNRGSS